MPPTCSAIHVVTEIRRPKEPQVCVSCAIGCMLSNVHVDALPDAKAGAVRSPGVLHKGASTKLVQARSSSTVGATVVQAFKLKMVSEVGQISFTTCVEAIVFHGSSSQKSVYMRDTVHTCHRDKEIPSYRNKHTPTGRCVSGQSQPIFLSPLSPLLP